MEILGNLKLLTDLHPISVAQHGSRIFFTALWQLHSDESIYMELDVNGDIGGLLSCLELSVHSIK